MLIRTVSAIRANTVRRRLAPFLLLLYFLAYLVLSYPVVRVVLLFAHVNHPNVRPARRAQRRATAHYIH